MKHLTDEQVDQLIKSLDDIVIDTLGDYYMCHAHDNIEVHYCHNYGKIEIQEIQAIKEHGEDYGYTPDQLQRLEAEMTDRIVYEGKALDQMYIDEDYYKEELKD